MFAHLVPCHEPLASALWSQRPLTDQQGSLVSTVLGQQRLTMLGISAGIRTQSSHLCCPAPTALRSRYSSASQDFLCRSHRRFVQQLLCEQLLRLPFGKLYYLGFSFQLDRVPRSTGKSMCHFAFDKHLPSSLFLRVVRLYSAGRRAEARGSVANWAEDITTCVAGPNVAPF